MQSTPSQLDTMQLLQAYERAIDENIISSITDTKGTIVHVNQKFQETSQYTEADLVGQNHRIVNSGFHPAEFFKGMWQTIGGGNVWHAEVKNKAKDGSFYWVDTVVVPIKDEQKKNTHYLSLRTLITSRKALEHEKEDHVAALESLLVMTSQRIRKPLAAVAQQMNRSTTDKPLRLQELNELMDNVKVSVSELDTFTKELTTFIRDMKV